MSIGEHVVEFYINNVKTTFSFFVEPPPTVKLIVPKTIKPIKDLVIFIICLFFFSKISSFLLIIGEHSVSIDRRIYTTRFGVEYTSASKKHTTKGFIFVFFIIIIYLTPVYIHRNLNFCASIIRSSISIRNKI